MFDRVVNTPPNTPSARLFSSITQAATSHKKTTRRYLTAKTDYFIQFARPIPIHDHQWLSFTKKRCLKIRPGPGPLFWTWKKMDLLIHRLDWKTGPQGVKFYWPDFSQIYQLFLKDHKKKSLGQVGHFS